MRSTQLQQGCLSTRLRASGRPRPRRAPGKQRRTATMSSAAAHDRAPARPAKKRCKRWQRRVGQARGAAAQARNAAADKHAAARRRGGAAARRTSSAAADKHAAPGRTSTQRRSGQVRGAAADKFAALQRTGTRRRGGDASGRDYVASTARAGASGETSKASPGAYRQAPRRGVIEIGGR
jgi:hypothetical protein